MWMHWRCDLFSFSLSLSWQAQGKVMSLLDGGLHPRFFVPLMGFLVVGFMIFGGGDRKQYSRISESALSGGEQVEAWLNPNTKRWETPAPWNPVR